MAEQACAVDECETKSYRRGLCRLHYQRLRDYGDPLTIPPERVYPATCEGCDEFFIARRPDTRCCSSYCRSVVAARKERAARQDARPVTTCLWCTADLSHLRADAKYCSDYCSNRADFRDNRERIAVAGKRYRETNPGKVFAADRRYRHANREAIYARQARWQQDNRDHHKRYQQEYQRAYRGANAARIRLRTATRYAQKRSNGPGALVVSARDWHRMLLAYQHRCAYCGNAAADLQLEHVIPLARGGRHAIGNLVPACPPCNYSKNDRLLVEWRYGRRRVRRRPTVH